MGTTGTTVRSDTTTMIARHQRFEEGEEDAGDEREGVDGEGGRDGFPPSLAALIPPKYRKAVSSLGSSPEELARWIEERKRRHPASRQAASDRERDESERDAKRARPGGAGDRGEMDVQQNNHEGESRCEGEADGVADSGTGGSGARARRPAHAGRGARFPGRPQVWEPGEDRRRPHEVLFAPHRKLPSEMHRGGDEGTPSRAAASVPPQAVAVTDGDEGADESEDGPPEEASSKSTGDAGPKVAVRVSATPGATLEERRKARERARLKSSGKSAAPSASAVKHVVVQRSSLLRKVMAPEMERETSIILQCLIRFQRDGWGERGEGGGGR